jgi:hypothetical protein
MPPATNPPPKPPIAIFGDQFTIQAVKLSLMKMLSAPCLKTFPNFILRSEDIAAIMPFQRELDDPCPHSGQTAEEVFARMLVGDWWWSVARSDSSVPSKTFPAPSSVTNAYKKYKEMLAEELGARAGISDDDFWYHDPQRGEQQESKLARDDYKLAVEYSQNLVVRAA